MKPDFESNDPLADALAMEELGLAKSAAALARERARARRRNAWVAKVAAVLMVGTGLFLRWERRIKAVSSNNVQPVSPVAALVHPEGFARIYPAGGPPPEEEIPPDATADERELLTTLRGVPFLLVKNERGEVSEIHIFEQ